MTGGGNGGVMSMQLSHGVHYTQGGSMQQSQMYMPYSLSTGSIDDMQEGY
jgi:hypothetical protein